MTLQKIQSDDPNVHARNIAQHIHELAEHCRNDIKIIQDPKALTLFATAAEVLGGLEKAFRKYRDKSEKMRGS